MENMNIPKREDLKMLLRKQKGLGISFYMPTYRAGRETRQNSIRFKNLVGDAREQLEAHGLRKKEIQELMDPALRLLKNSFYWNQQSDGLAVFLSRERFIHYRVPYRFKELVVVHSRFHIKPLLALFKGDGRFYILAISQKNVRLFQGSQFSVSEVNLGDIPQSLHEALRYDNLEKHIQFHTGTPSRPGKRGAMYHGHGAGKDDMKANILRYFQVVNKGVHEFIGSEETPLVLAGVDYILSLYREANTYSHLMEDDIKGNPDDWSETELHKRAWNIVQPLFLRSQKEARNEYKKQMAKSQASNKLETIVPAASRGRVAVLFVPLGIQKWGVFRPRKNEILVQEEARATNQDLLDLAAVQTVINGGKVYVLDPKRMPENASIAAIFRY
jgi:hypothetical protein